MNNDDIKSLCISLMNSETEDEVIAILKKAGYWDDPKYWRLYGDTESNWSAAGNQANEPEAALVEKITNSRDARLMLECMLSGVEPESETAPSSVKGAIGKYFNVGLNSDVEGEIKELSKSRRTQLAEGITISMTGKKPKDGLPCISIADCGEGQSPKNIPGTILSLKESVKAQIKFAHGKFNMGGTASLRYCSLQFVLSKRHPQLLKRNSSQSENDGDWGFTIVRREMPQGKRKSSWYKYLAPINAETKSEKGEILSFSSNEMPIFPEQNNPYQRKSEWGTLIKLFDYKTKFKSHALRPDGLLNIMDLLLPDIGLPVRMHECRKEYRGHVGSFANTLNGLQTRLFDDQKSNLEIPEPITESLMIKGNPYKLTIYVFKEGRAGTYRTRDKAILYTLNGQAQKWSPERFFSTSKVNLDYLADSLLVIVDCSELSYVSQEDLFQNSRDRFTTLPIAEELEDEIKDSLKNNPLLKELQQKRRQERALAKLDNSKPLETVLKSILRHSPTLSRIFSKGLKLTNAFAPRQVMAEKIPFEGKRFPTFFKIKKVEYGKAFEKHCPVNTRCRIFFETDAQNDYLKRDNSPGKFVLNQIFDGQGNPYDTYKVNLSNGIATLNITLPPSAKVNDIVEFSATLSDVDHIILPFVNPFRVIVEKEVNENGGGDNTRRLPPVDKPGNDREVPGGITIPENIFEVAKNPKDTQLSWSKEGFDENTGMVIKRNAEFEDDTNANAYDWYINVDNIYLLNEVKASPDKADLLKAQFKYALVLVGLSVMYSTSIAKEKEKEQSTKNSNGETISISEQVKQVTQSICPVLIPLINELGEILDETVVKEI